MPVAWITGGARRIGKGLALALAERGYDIGFTYNTSKSAASNVSDTIKAMGRNCVALQCNVSNVENLKHVCSSFEESVGLADVVISCAGVFPSALPVADVSVEMITDTIAINTLPFFTLAQYYKKACTKVNKEGRLIAIGSLGAMEIWQDRLAYNVSKRALSAMADSLARSLAPTITVNTVAPGAIAQPQDMSINDSSLVSANRIPMGRHGTVEDVVDAVWFFCNASRYITGQTIVVDGGYRLVR